MRSSSASKYRVSVPCSLRTKFIRRKPIHKATVATNRTLATLIVRRRDWQTHNSESRTSLRVVLYQGRSWRRSKRIISWLLRRESTKFGIWRKQDLEKQRLPSRARGFLWCRLNGALPLYSYCTNTSPPLGGGAKIKVKWPFVGLLALFWKGLLEAIFCWEVK